MLSQKAAQELNEREKYFDIFVMSTGRWCAWDPAPDDRTKVESEKWADKDQQEIMNNLEKMNAEKQKKDLSELNALVGKKKDMIQQSEVDHKQRIADSIKQGIAEKDAPKHSLNLNKPQTDNINEDSVEPSPRKSHNNQSIKEKLRKKLEEKRKVEQTSKMSDEVINQVNNQAQLEENINKAKAILQKIQNKST